MTTKPDLTRIWAGSALPSEVVDPDTVEAGKFAAGWAREVPPYEYFNFIHNFCTSGLAYFNEQGIGEWDTDTEYPQWAVTKRNGIQYLARVANDGDDPELVPESWAIIPQFGVVRLSGGGALVPGAINYLEDSDAYTLPLAADYPDGFKITAKLGDINGAETPSVEVTGSDSLEDIDGVDADGDFLFDAGWFEQDFISNGVDTWEI